MAEGWISLHRKLQDNPLWYSESFTRGQAWVDLLLLANHEYGYFYKRGVKIEIQRGQVGMSELGLSERWKWSRSKVRKFLKELEKEQQIEQQKSNVTQVVTIINYDLYQKKEQQTIQQKDTKRTPKEHQKDTNNKKNNENNENNKNKYAEFVSMTEDEFNKLYDQHGDVNTNIFIDILNNYKGSNGKKYKSDYRAILNWVVDKAKKDGKYKQTIMPQ